MQKLQVRRSDFVKVNHYFDATTTTHTFLTFHSNSKGVQNLQTMQIFVRYYRARKAIHSREGFCTSCSLSSL